MLHFFRRFQKGIFVVITFMIVISFSFFGTKSVVDRAVKDEEVFTAIDGKSVKRSEIENLVSFLSSDVQDQANWGVPLGANFLNDGVIRNDFLKTGLGKVLFIDYYPELKDEWEMKWRRERTFIGYRHPEVPTLSSESVWSHFAPDLKESLRQFKAGDSENPGAFFAAKARLYLAEGEFSENHLRQVLYFLMQQQKWIKLDRNLQQQNLALFGYRNSSDWFGRDFLRLTAAFILNASKVAAQAGYQVTHDEALFDLKKNALLAFEGQKQNPQMTFTDPNHYLREQLRYLGMDLGQAADLWQKVLLFRKMFNDLGSAVFVDKESLQPYVDYVSKQVEVASYHLPKEVQIRDFRQMQRLETYLQAVNREFPHQWKSAQEVELETPELLVKRYLVALKEVDPKQVAHSKVGLKALWDWQVSDAGWEKLLSHFPALSHLPNGSAEERLSSLDGLDELTKEKVNSQSKQWIALEHPEWIHEALARAPAEKKTLLLYRKTSKNPLKGIARPEKVVALLDAPELNPEAPPVVMLSDVGEKVWEATLYDRSSSWEIATFAESEKDGVLEELTLAKLKKHYEETNLESGYLTADGSPKPFSEVRDQLAQDLYRRELNKIKRHLPEEVGPSIDSVASYRLYTYLLALKEELAQDPHKEADLIYQSQASDEGHLAPRPSLENQFKLVREEKVWDRSQNPTKTSFASLMAMAPDQFSEVIPSGRGDLFFFKMGSFPSSNQSDLTAELVEKTQSRLAGEIKVALAQELLKQFKEKQAIRLSGFKGDRAV